jgi:serine protease Do
MMEMIDIYDPLRSKMKLIFYSAVACLFGLGITSALGWTGVTHSMPVLDTQPQISTEAVQPALDLSDAFVNVSEMVTPGVVRIEARRQAPAAQEQPSRLFRNLPEQNQQDRPDQVASGSGFVVSPDGYILTNNHVVADATTLTVFLQDRRSFPATLVGRDPFTDVAVIKIEAENLGSLSLGDSDALRVGEWIVAIGNPGFGGTSRPLDYTVTVGIISALGRPLLLLQQELNQNPETRAARGFAIEDFIQTDAVINPGNSGGPMVNLRGQVVGINSAIASRTGFYQGYGFAIPIDLARRVMEDLVEYGRVRRAWLGIAMTGVDAISAESYGLPTVSGVEVTQITPDGPAEEHGLMAYDVIVAIDDQQVGRTGQLQQSIARRRPGDRIDVTVYRDRRERTINVRLGEATLNAEPVTVAAAPVRDEPRMDDKLGLRIENMSREFASDYGFREVTGAAITDVQVNGPAARRGLRPGFRVIEINRQPVDDASDVLRIMSDVDRGDIVTLRVEPPTGQPQVFHVRISQ